MVLQCGDGVCARARLHMAGTVRCVQVDEWCDGHLPAACHPLLRRITSSSNFSEIRDCFLASLIGRDGARVAQVDALRRDATPSRAVFQLPLLRPVREHTDEKPWHFAITDIVGLGPGLEGIDRILGEFTLDGHNWSAPGRHERETKSNCQNNIESLPVQESK